MSQQGEEVGKLFVGGLSWETTQESLCRFFSRFGEVIDCVVMKNNETGRSRGFGFVTFKDPTCVQVVLSSGPHNLDGRTIDPKACNPRSMQKSAGDHKQKNKGNNPKIFLGGLPSNITETDLRNFFGKYGKVLEVVIMFDQEKKRSRGFGFLSFETEDSVDQVCAEHYVVINGKQVECKRAEPRDGRTMVNKPGNQWNGTGMNMGMGPGGMPPPHMGGPMGGPGMGPPPMGPMPNGMPGNMIGGGYQPGGWGAPQQPGGYGQGYGAPPPSSGYQGWGPSGYGPYGPPGPQYGSPPQGGYGGYGPPGPGGYPGYNWGSPPAVPPGPAPPAPGTAPMPGQDMYSQQEQAPTAGAATGVATGNTSAPSTTTATTATTTSQPVQKQDFVTYSSTYGSMGSYPQESSSFGPTRTYGSGVGQDGIQTSNYNQAGGQTAGQGYSGQNDSQSSTYSGSQTLNFNRNSTPSQGYHPYRRQ